MEDGGRNERDSGKAVCHFLDNCSSRWPVSRFLLIHTLVADSDVPPVLSVIVNAASVTPISVFYNMTVRDLYSPAVLYHKIKPTVVVNDGRTSSSRPRFSGDYRKLKIE